MAAGRMGLLLLLMAAQLVPPVSGCNRGHYERIITDLCLAKFNFEMGAVDPGSWCRNCTFQVALRMDCFWPDQVVDRFFMQVHRTYFQDCALTGRLLHDPPVAVLAPFIVVPVLITLLMTALVVWRSKRTEGVL